MNLNEFNELDIDQKAQYTWDNGQRIDSVADVGFSYTLYRTLHFYVEFEFSNEFVSNIRAFKQGNHLEKYLERVDLTELLN